MKAALLAFVSFATSFSAAWAQSQEDETDAHGYDKIRIEQEEKLLVPEERVEEVWNYLRQHLCEDKAFVTSLDPNFTAKWSEELFQDTYFDTPSMQLHEMQSGVRHRIRRNLTNPDDAKSGRQLMQIKMNDISGNQLERGEIKYEIDTMPRDPSPEGRHPMLGRVTKEHREPFKARLREMGLVPESMRPIVTVRDVRRRIYLLENGQPFMSISHDQASAEMWWASVHFCEIEPELNEIGFTEASAEKRAYMETLLRRIVQDIQTKFPDIQSNLTPKYNKSFDRLAAEIPFLRAIVRMGLQDDGGVIIVFGGVALVAGIGTLPRVLRRKRGAKAQARGPAVA